MLAEEEHVAEPAVLLQYVVFVRSMDTECARCGYCIA